MPASAESIYTPARLDHYSLSKRIQIKLASAVFYYAIKLIGYTVEFETRGMEHFENVSSAGKVPIYAFWHDRIFLGTYFFRERGMVVMSSQSFDGEYMARFLQRFGYGSVRGSSSRGGVKALVEMVRGMRRGLPMAFTVDGPRGPRYEAKPGIVLLAQKTGNPIVPCLLEPQHYWMVSSWDRMQIPRPFTRCLVTAGPPIYVGPTEAIDTKRDELQASLMSLVREGELWREGSGVG